MHTDNSDMCAFLRFLALSYVIYRLKRSVHVRTSVGTRTWGGRGVYFSWGGGKCSTSGIRSLNIAMLRELQEAFSASTPVRSTEHRGAPFIIEGCETVFTQL